MCTWLVIRRSQPAAVAWSDACLIGDHEVLVSIPPQVWQHSYVEIDHEMFSTIILSLLLIQEGQLSVSGERMCTSTGSPFWGLSLSRKSVLTMLGMTLMGGGGCKTSA